MIIEYGDINNFRKLVKYKKCILNRSGGVYPSIARLDYFDWSDVSDEIRSVTICESCNPTKGLVGKKWIIRGVISEHHLIINRHNIFVVVDLDAVEILDPINLRSEYEIDPELFKL
jgi:hypothetical protein